MMIDGRDIYPRRYVVLRMIQEIYEGLETPEFESALRDAIPGSANRLLREMQRIGATNDALRVFFLLTDRNMFLEMPTYLQNAAIKYSQEWWSLELERSFRVGYATRESLERVFGEFMYEDELYDDPELSSPGFAARLPGMLELDLEKIFPIGRP